MPDSGLLQESCARDRSGSMLLKSTENSKALCPDCLLYTSCFSQGLDYARECLDLGGYIGLGGTLTYPRNGYLRDMLAFLPLDRVLVETDCPYLPPQARRGKRNEPSFILEVISAIAEVLGSTAGEIARLTLENGRRVFGIMEQKW